MKSLLENYEDIVKKVSTPDETRSRMLSPVNKLAYKNRIAANCNTLKDAAAKKVVFNIYTNVLPLDDDYKEGNRGILKDDVDCLLASKKTDAYNYLKSSAQNTRSPLLEYVVRCLDVIGSTYMEEAEKELKDNEDKNLDIPPEEVNPDNEEYIDNALVDINTDDDYESFITQLKKQTIDKIVADITELINSEDQDNNMQFNTANVNESSAQVALSYLMARQIEKTENERRLDTDSMIGLAIRESVLNSIDSMFKQPQSSLREYKTRIHSGRSIVLERVNALPVSNDFFG